MKKIFFSIGVLLFIYSSNLAALEAEAHSISKDKTLLAIGFDDNVIRLYSLKTGKLLQTFRGHNKSIQSLDFSSDNAQLLSGSWDDHLIIWNVKSGKIIKNKDMGSTVYISYFTLNDKNIVVSSEDKQLILYNLDLKKKVESFNVNERLQISKNRKFLIAQVPYDAVALIDLENKKEIIHEYMDSYDDHMYFSDDASTVVVRDNSNFYVWDIIKKEPTEMIHSSIGANVANLNSYKNELWIANNNKIGIWNYKEIRQKALVRLNKLDIDDIEKLVFTSSGDRAAILVKLNSNERKVIILDTKTYEIRSVIKLINKSYFELEFIDNKNLLLYSSHYVEVWNIKEKKKVWSFTNISYKYKN